ncbi:MAG TPA: selenoneine biosynthesis selenosugar synthase SenB [Candidatus Binatia bacterium]|jgi:putative glycosyltransferase (TIGR04348 family)
MKIRLVTPAGPADRNGNSITALRWARILRQLGHRVFVDDKYRGETCDLLIALHARKSAESIRRFSQEHPELPLVVVLTGTDLYRDIRISAAARQSLELATRLIVLQSMGLAEVPRRWRGKTRVIYQSASRVRGRPPSRSVFDVCVIGHLRAEKDSLRTALAIRLLPPSSKLRVFHVGRAMNEQMGKRARAETERNPRYRWLGERPHWKTRRLLASSQLLSLTSRMEGSANVLSEALASSVPVVASKISGLIGTLGKQYPGYFPVGDTRALARVLRRAESDPRFYHALKSHCARLRPLVDPKRERDAWKKLLDELQAATGA